MCLSEGMSLMFCVCMKLWLVPSVEDRAVAVAWLLFFFQAEDGIRDLTVTGVQTCALPISALRAIRGRRIGVVFQDPLGSLNPLFTIGEQLEETIRTHLGLAGKELRQRALALLAEVGIPAPQARFHHYPHQFSGGMRQRVVIALALAAEPILLIADQPTTALDVSMQAQIIALIKRVARERGAAVMLITHDMGVIAETAHRVAVMYAGRVVEVGGVRDVIHAPQHPFTVGLMGSIPPIGPKRGPLGQIDWALPRLDAIPPGR